MDATHFLAFGIKDIIPAVPHINVCRDLEMPDIPTGNLAFKKHIFNLKQMKLTVCHVCRATSELSTMKYECFCCSHLKPLLWYFTMYFSKPKNGTASFGDVFKIKNEGEVYHFLALYFKDDF